MRASTEPLSHGRLLRLDPRTGELRARAWRLTVVFGPDQGASAPLDQLLQIGSGDETGFKLSDTTVSRLHVELEPRAEGVRVRDLGSTNGTFLGGARVAEALVEAATVVTVGKTGLKVSAVDEAAPAAPHASLDSIVGDSRKMAELRALLGRVAATDSTVLLLGETGTGKEVIARAVHEASGRAGKPFVVFDCGAVAPSMIESELFGHTRGAFTGAVADRAGALQSAGGGTLFLDELGELPLELQPKLLRALETGTYRRVGDDSERRANVRVIAATHRDLEAAVEKGKFRRDLYFRLAVVPIRVPALRERLDDIPLLVQHFAKVLGRGDFALSAELQAKLAGHAWPGNVRELRNFVERALVGQVVETGTAGGAGPAAVPAALKELPYKEAKEQLIESFTREYIASLLERHGGNIAEAARAAGLARTYLHEMVGKYKLGR